ncbi:oxygenase MpaB family protein [Nocardioides sp. AE5]|uniref:oxygenase MpaB family protein n=1 Tax=Nocardioides sp. AE5 TaxID=2962573 RepID=UPI002880E1F0|nr:oxygenase MpaB family protein [Nocardioides sp. AE5]MDT0202467.1 oxygenase MpaB family protein [Nocardioides sp. AE5]
MTYYPELLERVHDQARMQPALYGDIDFSHPPHRLTTDPETRASLPAWVAPREPMLADDRLVELVTTTTMLGDVVADPYASLLPRFGLPKLIAMLRQACREGVDAVPDAPPELHTFLAALEERPDWLDMDLVEEGARHARVSAAFLSPFITRGAFLATFLNTYAALPMVLTGALSGRRASVRVNETACFFAETTLPGALARDGVGFESAAMVRLMHSMVRFNALHRSQRWDTQVYGVPIPQIDQMPAGMIIMYLLAMAARRRGRTDFTQRERAMLEFARYRSFLLGLPEELLPTDVAGVIDLFHARAATLRDDFDDTCRELVTSTMAAYLRPGRAPFDRLFTAVEKTWSRAFFLAFNGGDRAASARMGAPFGPTDALRLALTAPLVFGRLIAVTVASGQPGLSGLADRYAQRVLARRLVAYGKPEYTTDARHYRSAAP